MSNQEKAKEERLGDMSQKTKDRIDALMELPLWWGYLHVNGSVHVKLFFDNRDLHEAHESPFVEAVCTPMPCKDLADALAKFLVKFRIKKEEEVKDEV